MECDWWTLSLQKDLKRVSPDQKRTIMPIMEGNHDGPTETWRANIDSDPYLVASKVHTRLRIAKMVWNQTQSKLDIHCKSAITVGNHRGKHNSLTHPSPLLMLILKRSGKPSETLYEYKNLIILRKAHMINLKRSGNIIQYEKQLRYKSWYDGLAS